MLRPCILLLLGFLLVLSGCDRNPLGTIDQRGNAPAVSSFTITPAGVRIDTIPPANNIYSVVATVSAQVADPDGTEDIASVTAQALSPSGVTAAETILHDDGVSPDAIGGDGVFTGTLRLPLARADIGIYRILYTASDRSQHSGTSALRNFPVTRRSSPPWLSRITAPDTIIIPIGGGASFRVGVTAADSDGLADITDVRLRIPEGSNPTTVLHLLDNGDLASNGDTTAGDGIYSIILRVNDSPTVRKRYSLLFQAVDKAGDTSATLTHYLTMQ